MADNFLERQYDDYLRDKVKREAAKRKKWRKQLEDYKKKQSSQASKPQSIENE